MENKQVKKTPRLVLTPEEAVRRETNRDEEGVNETAERSTKIAAMFEGSAPMHHEVWNAVEDLVAEGKMTRPKFGSAMKEKAGLIAEYLKKKRSGTTETQQLESETKRPTNFKVTMLKAAKARATSRK